MAFKCEVSVLNDGFGHWTLDVGLSPDLLLRVRMMQPLEIDVRTVKQMLDRSEKFVLLDCRENSEVATARIAGTLHIPMRDIPARIAELGSKEDRIVVHCHHGGRSQRVTQFLRQQGFQHAQNMSGGIDAWSQEVDSSVPRYE
jgi:rhodanese-related sulfurtransferase